jgi:glycerol-3-phosphate acyltransferase PlsY
VTSLPGLAVACGLAFTLGAIPFSWILARLVGGVDIRNLGSGNVGATNVARTLGYGPGMLALVLDALKGVAAVLAARAIAGGGAQGGAVDALSGGLAVLGHNFTPFLRFRGGKGVATGAGVFGLLAPAALAVSVVLFAVAMAATRTVSIGSVLAAAAIPFGVFFFGGDPALVLMSVLVSALVIARHRTNLARILAGTERRLGGGRGGGAGR